MKDWIGETYVKQKNKSKIAEKYLSFEQAREFVHSLNLPGCKEWLEYVKTDKKPVTIPSNPYAVYKDKWISYPDWLGVNTKSTRDIAKGFLPFEKARAYVRTLGFKNSTDWNAYAFSDKRAKEIPSQPAKNYKGKGWDSLMDWIGVDKKPSAPVYVSYEEAREFVRSLHLKNVREWHIFTKSENMPVNIPPNPYEYYKGKGWVSYSDFIGNENSVPVLDVI